MKNIIERTFEEMYFGEQTLFAEYVEQYFLDTVIKKASSNIEGYLWEYYKWYKKLSKETKENLIIVFKQNT